MFMARPLCFGRERFEHLYQLVRCMCGQNGWILNSLESEVSASNRNVPNEIRRYLNLAGTYVIWKIGKPEKLEPFAKKRVRGVSNSYVPRPYVCD